MTEEEITPLFNIQMQDTKRDVVTYSISKTKNSNDFRIVSHPKSEMSSLALKLHGYILECFMSNKFPKFVREI
jgi:hypothetical protein